MRRAACALIVACLAGALPAGPARAAVTLVGNDTYSVPSCALPAGLEFLFGDPGVAFVACTNFAREIVPHRVTPGVPLGPEPSVPTFPLPADLNGSLPNPGFSVFIDDVWIESPTLGWITTSGEETVATFDPNTGLARSVLFEGIVRPSVPTDRTITGSFTRTDGTVIASFTTGFTSGAVRVGDRLLVTTSNFHTTGTVPVLNPGTVLLYDVDDSSPSLMLVTPAVPPWLITTDPNPTALTPLPNGLVAVTNSGEIHLTAPPSAAGPASVDIVDPAAGAILASIPLGNAGPAFRRLAVDPTGSVALVGSAVFRQLYALDLRSTGALPVPAGDPTAQRPSCTGSGTAGVGGIPCAPQRVIAGTSNPIAVPPCSGFAACSSATDGYTAEVKFGESGDFAVATAFNDGLVAVLGFDPSQLATPHPLLDTRFGGVEAFGVTPPLGTFPADTGPGPMLLIPSAGGTLPGTEVLVLTRDLGTLLRATLGGSPLPPGGDSDGDGPDDVTDNCPVTWNPGQADGGGPGSSAPDGVGDLCQCGDVNGDGQVQIDDAALIARELALLGPGLTVPDHCNVQGLPGSGAGTCDAGDVSALREALAGAPLQLLCGPAQP